MKTINIRELKPYTKNNLLKLLDNSENTFKKLIKYDIVDMQDDMYQFKYVGIIIIDKLVINCYPKYFTNYSNDNFKQIIQVIKKYNASNDLDYQNEELEDISFNLLSMMVFFLEDYYEYGIYSNVQNILEVNGNGEIDWNSTINYTDPIINDNKPYYVELYTKYKIDDLYDYFRLLHEYIITVCSKRLEKAGLLELFDLTPVELSDKELYEFGELEFILKKLEKELHVEFNSHKIKLLKSMHTFLKEQNSFSNENYLTLFGTSSYHVIWEAMLKKIFDDKLNSIVEFKGKKTKLIDVIKKPKWIYKDIKTHKAKRTFIPDIVTFYHNEFIILDAKYYNLKFDENELDGQPGLESITKQYLYELAFGEFIDYHGFKNVKNAFLFPTYDNNLENKGKVKFDILSDQGCVDIGVIMIPAGKLNQMYLNNNNEFFEINDLINIL